MGVRVPRPLCRDPHVLLDADSELDLDLIVMVDLDSLHQPGNDHSTTEEVASDAEPSV